MGVEGGHTSAQKSRPTHSWLARAQGQRVLAYGKIKADLHFKPRNRLRQHSRAAQKQELYSSYAFINSTLLFCKSPSSVPDIETNCGGAMKAALLINSSWMASYLLAFDVRHLCKGYGRMQSRALSSPGPPLRSPASSRDRPSFRKYWLLDSESVCVHVRVLGSLLWKVIANGCVCLRVLGCCVSMY